MQTLTDGHKIGRHEAAWITEHEETIVELFEALKAIAGGHRPWLLDQMSFEAFSVAVATWSSHSRPAHHPLRAPTASAARQVGIVRSAISRLPTQ